MRARKSQDRLFGFSVFSRKGLVIPSKKGYTVGKNEQEEKRRRYGRSKKATKMKTYIDIFRENKIDLYAALRFSDCCVTKPHLLSRLSDLTPKSLLLFLVPYYTGETENLSVYAAGRDYHAFMRELSDALIAALRMQFPRSSFYPFADHSPIDERLAAAKAGLGVVGKNRLLLTEKYSSFVFIGEIISDLSPEKLSAVEPQAVSLCDGCNACQSACPSGLLRGDSAICLSALTQKKGCLTEDEACLIGQNGSAWGCDACQNVCPYTQRARANGTLMTQIPYFYQDRMAKLSSAAIQNMSEEDFLTRAFSWRGREVLLRNLSLFADT